MTNDIKTCLTLCLLTSIAAAQGQGTFVLWDESVNGPLSQDGRNPTSLETLQIGRNTIFSFVEFIPSGPGPGGILYSDFFTVNVPTGTRITEIDLGSDKPLVAWIGDNNFSSELGSVIDPANGSLLPQLGVNSIAHGLYGIYISNDDLGSSPSVASYRLDFIVQAVPEPTVLGLLFTGGLVAIVVKRCFS